MPLLRSPLYPQADGAVEVVQISSSADSNSKQSGATLVVAPSWVGDMVMAQSLLMVLKKSAPSVPIDLLAPQWVLPLAERMPEVRKGIENPLGHGKWGWSARKRLGKQLRGKYRRCYVLPNSFKSALIPFWAGIPERIGYRGELRYGVLTRALALDKKQLPRTVERFVALADQGRAAAEIEHPRLVVDKNSQRSAQQQFNLDADTAPVLGLCPGAEYGPAKRWPPAYFAEVAKAKIASGWQVWLFGSAKDRQITGEINRLTGSRCSDLAGVTTLAQACDLMALTSAVVTNDSGLMHVAAALDRPLYCLFGSSDPGFTPPLSATATIFHLGLDCSPCFKRECPLSHLDCLNKLLPERVVSALP